MRGDYTPLANRRLNISRGSQSGCAAYNPHYVLRPRGSASVHGRPDGLCLFTSPRPNPSANGLCSARSRKRLARSRARPYRPHAAPKGASLGLMWSCKTLALQEQRRFNVPRASRVGSMPPTPAECRCACQTSWQPPRHCRKLSQIGDRTAKRTSAKSVRWVKMLFENVMLTG